MLALQRFALTECFLAWWRGVVVNTLVKLLCAEPGYYLDGWLFVGRLTILVYNPTT